MDPLDRPYPLSPGKRGFRSSTCAQQSPTPQAHSSDPESARPGWAAGPGPDLPACPQALAVLSGSHRRPSVLPQGPGAQKIPFCAPTTPRAQGGPHPPALPQPEARDPLCSRRAGGQETTPPGAPAGLPGLGAHPHPALPQGLLGDHPHPTLPQPEARGDKAGDVAVAVVWLRRAWGTGSRFSPTPDVCLASGR